MKFGDIHFLHLADLVEREKALWAVAVRLKKNAGRLAEIIACTGLIIVLFSAFGYVLYNWPILGSIWLMVIGVICRILLRPRQELIKPSPFSLKVRPQDPRRSPTR